MPAFRRSVFVNCPLDQEYYPLLRPLLFTILSMGLVPRLAIERSDSGESRLQKIIELIEQSQFAIHDLSRCRARKRGEFFRLNMPFELGLDVGCKRFKTGRWRRKRCLILETERYRFNAAISDMSGSDISAHKNEPETVVRVVRDWLVQEAHAAPKSPSQIWGLFSDFMAENDNRLINEGYTRREISELPISELQEQMENWIS
jgi:hypothetical protein